MSKANLGTESTEQRLRSIERKLSVIERGSQKLLAVGTTPSGRWGIIVYDLTGTQKFYIDDLGVHT